MVWKYNEVHLIFKLWSVLYLDRSPAFLTSDDFIRFNEIIRKKWLIYKVIGHFVLTISLDFAKSLEVRKAGDRSK